MKIKHTSIYYLVCITRFEFKYSLFKPYITVMYYSVYWMNYWFLKVIFLIESKTKLHIRKIFLVCKQNGKVITKVLYVLFDFKNLSITKILQ